MEDELINFLTGKARKHKYCSSTTIAQGGVSLELTKCFIGIPAMACREVAEGNGVPIDMSRLGCGLSFVLIAYHMKYRMMVREQKYNKSSVIHI